MYDTWRQTLDGMSKNSFEITESVAGSILIALFFLFMGWGWLLAGKFAFVALGLFMLGGLFVGLIARSAIWPVLLAPFIPTIGAFTVLRSAFWHRTGRVTWKGRVYGGKG
jgi:predicted ABC-type sugar transport system permease subunit